MSSDEEAPVDQRMFRLGPVRRHLAKLLAENKRQAFKRMGTNMSKKHLVADVYTDYALEDRIEQRRLQEEDDKRELKEMQRKHKLSDRLIEWAQNNEMVDNKYTDHGKDCLEAAKLLKEFK